MLGSKLAPQTLCQPAQSKCMSQQLFMRKFAGKMPSPKVATHTLTPCSTLRSRNAHGQVTSNLQERCRAPRLRGKLCASLRHGAQEPFYVRIYRENAGGQTEHPYLTPAFYLQPLSVDTFGEQKALCLLVGFLEYQNKPSPAQFRQGQVHPITSVCRCQLGHPS